MAYPALPRILANRDLRAEELETHPADRPAALYAWTTWRAPPTTGSWNFSGRA